MIITTYDDGTKDDSTVVVVTFTIVPLFLFTIIKEEEYFYQNWSTKRTFSEPGYSPDTWYETLNDWFIGKLKRVFLGHKGIVVKKKKR